MLMYEMLTGLPPWYTKDRQKLFERLREAPLVIPRNVSAPSSAIITGLLNRNPSKRLGTHGALQVKVKTLVDITVNFAIYCRFVLDNVEARITLLQFVFQGFLHQILPYEDERAGQRFITKELTIFKTSKSANFATVF